MVLEGEYMDDVKISCVPISRLFFMQMFKVLRARMIKKTVIPYINSKLDVDELTVIVCLGTIGYIIHQVRVIHRFL